VVAVTFLGAITAAAQIPNAGFEQWTAGNPDGWMSNNIPPVATPVSQSSNRHGGSFSAQAEVVNALGSPYPPVLWSQFPVSQRHATLTFWVEFTSVGGDGASVEVLLYNNQAPIGAGFGETFQSQPWELVTIDIEYFTTEIPDSCIIYFVVASDTGDPHVGSTARIDDLAFVGIVGVDDTEQQPLAFGLDQNYPNPFNPSTTIKFQTQKSGFVSLRVYDILGREAAVLVNGEMETGEHTVRFDASNLPSGVYFYRLTAGGSSISKRMMLVK
jgi:hypothetical protein